MSEKPGLETFNRRDLQNAIRERIAEREAQREDDDDREAK